MSAGLPVRNLWIEQVLCEFGNFMGLPTSGHPHEQPESREPFLKNGSLIAPGIIGSSASVITMRHRHDTQ